MQILLALAKSDTERREALGFGIEMGILSDNLGLKTVGNTLLLNLHANEVFTESFFNESLRQNSLDSLHVAGVSRDLASVLIRNALNYRKFENIDIFEVIVGHRGQQILRKTSLTCMSEEFPQYKMLDSTNPGKLRYAKTSEPTTIVSLPDLVSELKSCPSDEEKIAYFRENKENLKKSPIAKTIYRSACLRIGVAAKI